MPKTPVISMCPNDHSICRSFIGEVLRRADHSLSSDVVCRRSLGGGT
jgi:hypothetical protein